MILKGNQRGGARDLALHLLKDENDHVEIHELRGFMSDDLVSAFKEMYNISKATRAKKYLYSLSVNPPEGENVATEDFIKSINCVEKELKLTGHQRAIVFHEKNGRRHAHAVWSRIDTLQMKAVNIYKDWPKLQALTRELFLEHGWAMPEGLLDKHGHSPDHFTLAQWQQAQRIGKVPSQIKADLQSAWALSDDLASFEAALKERGYWLARGDRRGFVVLNHQCEPFSLGKKWLGIPVKDVRSRLGDEHALRSVEDTRTLIASTMSAHLAQLQDQQNSAIHARQERIKDQLKRLITTQRRERAALKTAQETRWQTETRTRQARLTTGLKNLLARATGQHRRTLKHNTHEARLARLRDQHEKDALIFTHLEQRQTLKHRLQRLEGFKMRSADKLSHDRTQYSDITRGLKETFERRAQLPTLKTDPAQALILPVDETERGLSARIRRSPEIILDILSDKQECFTYNDIVRGLKKHITEPADLSEAIKCVFAAKELVQIEDGNKAVYSTAQMQAIKTSIARHAHMMDKNKGHGVAAKHRNRAIDKHNTLLQQQVGAELSHEQRRAIHHLLSDQQLSIAVGLAGTGKSTLLAATNDAWQQQGRRVLGASLSGKAADGLQEASGIHSRTLASWQLSWKNGNHELQRGDVFVIDEAGMVGNKQLLNFMETVKERGAKLVLVGDPEQLQPINAGAPLKDLTGNLKHARLTEIRRQKHGWQRQASLDLAQGRMDNAIDAYSKQGAVVETQDKDEAISALVQDYIADLKQNGKSQSRIALSYRRKDVHKINQTIRAARQIQGELLNEQIFNTDHGARNFAKDDRIVFTQNDQHLNVRNGSFATVKSLTRNTITVEFDANDQNKPRRLTFHPGKYAAFDHGYATTIHKSQGVTVDQSFVLSAGQMDRHLTYVAMSRHKENTKLYIDQSRNKHARRNTNHALKQRAPQRSPSRGR